MLLLSTAALAMLGVIGYEALAEKSGQKTKPFYDLSVASFDNNNEQIRAELNHTQYNLNEMKRLLFVRNSAPESVAVKNLKKEVSEKEALVLQLNQSIKNHEKQIADEKSKSITLETSLAGLAELIDIQKTTKEKFNEALAELNETQKAVQEHKEALTLAQAKIDALKEIISTEQNEKQSLVSALELGAVSSVKIIHHGAELADEIAIENTLRRIQKANFAEDQKATLIPLQSAIENLEIELELAKARLDNEKHLKNESHGTLSALINKTSLLETEIAALHQQLYTNSELGTNQLQEVGEKGASLQDELVFEKTARALEKDRLNEAHAELQKHYQAVTDACTEWERNYAALEARTHHADHVNRTQFENLTTDITDSEQLLLFERLESKLAQERLKLELEDLSYALITSVHQYELEKKNFEDHHVIYTEEKKENDAKIARLAEELHFEHSEKQQRMMQIADLHETSASRSEEEKSYIASLELSLKNAEDALTKTALALEELEQETAGHTASLERIYNQDKENLQIQVTALEETIKQKEDQHYQGNLEIKQLNEEQIVSLETFQGQLKEDLHNALTEAANLQEQIAHMEINFKGKDQSENELLEIKRGQEEQIAVLEKALKEIEHNYALQHEQLKQELGTALNDSNILQMQITHLEETYKYKNSAEAQLQLEFEEKAAALNEVKEQQDLYIATLERTLKDLEQDHLQNKESLSVSANTEVLLKGNIEQSLLEAKGYQAKIVDLEIALQTKERDLNGNLEERKELEQEAAEIKRIKEERENHIVELQNALLDHKAQIAELEETVNRRETEQKENVETLQRNAKELEDEINEKEALHDELLSAHSQTTEELKSQIAALEESIREKDNAQKNELENHERNTQQLQDDLRKKQEDEKSLTSQIAMLEDTVKEKDVIHQADVEHLKTLLDEKQMQIEATKAEIEQVRQHSEASLAEKSTELQQLSTKLKENEIEKLNIKEQLEELESQ